MTYTVKILTKTYNVETIRAARNLWNEIVDKKNFGATTQCGCDVKVGRRVIARISYNGRVWLPLPEGEREIIF